MSSKVLCVEFGGDNNENPYTELFEVEENVSLVELAHKCLNRDFDTNEYYIDLLALGIYELDEKNNVLIIESQEGGWGSEGDYVLTFSIQEVKKL